MVAALLVLPLGLYLAGASAVTMTDGRRLTEVTCFEPEYFGSLSIARAAAATVMAVAAVGFLFVVPWMLGILTFMRHPRTRSTAHAWSLFANSAALVLLCLLLRHTTGIDRPWLCGAWLAWTAVLMAAAWRPVSSRAELGRLGRRYGGGLLVGLLIVLAAVVIFFPDQFVQCFTEDGTEACRLAASLQDHLLPYWELETGNRMGTAMVTPAMVNSYWTFALQTLLGESELATRLPFWIWWLAIFAAGYRIVTPASGGWWLPALPLGLLAFLAGVLFSFYVGYNPYMADLGNQGVFDGMFTLLLLLGLACMRQRDGWGWAIATALSFTIHYAGAVTLVCMLAAAWVFAPVPRKELVGWTLRAATLFAAVTGFYLAWGYAEGSLPYWLDTIDIEYVNDYLSPVPRWKSGLLFAGYFVLGCGGIAVVSLAWAFRRGAWQQTAATATLLYLAVVLCSGFKNLHYLGPLLPIPLVLLLAPRAGGKPASRRLCLAATCSLLVCIAASWPMARPVFTLNRQLGRVTTIATDDYLTAVQLTRLRYAMKEQGVISWDCDQHTWAEYSQLDAGLSRPRPLVLTEGKAPTPAYRLVASAPIEGTEIVARLYARGEHWTEWMRTRRPMRPLARYATVFIPLADGPYSPHNNSLEDVRRLYWPR